MLQPFTDETKAHLAAMHPFKGLGEPEDIAKAAVFLASEDASWISGIALPVDGKFLQYSRYLWDSQLTHIQVATPPGDPSYHISHSSRPKIWSSIYSLDIFIIYLIRNE